MLTPVGTDSGKVHNTEVVDHFVMFPASINTSSSDKWFRNKDLRNLRVSLESEFMDRMS
jgi:hypothetical protein